MQLVRKGQMIEKSLHGSTCSHIHACIVIISHINRLRTYFIPRLPIQRLVSRKNVPLACQFKPNLQPSVRVARNPSRTPSSHRTWSKPHVAESGIGHTDRSHSCSRFQTFTHHQSGTFRLFISIHRIEQTDNQCGIFTHRGIHIRHIVAASTERSPCPLYGKRMTVHVVIDYSP